MVKHNMEKLLCPGTRRRYYYELCLTGIRIILNEGWHSFFWKVRCHFNHRPMIKHNIDDSFFRNFSTGKYLKSRVALIQAPGWGVNTPPFAVASLTAYLRMHSFKVMPVDINVAMYQRNKERFGAGWKVDVEDFWYKSPNILNFISKNKEVLARYVDCIVKSGAKVIGFTIYSSSLLMSFYLAKEIKERAKDRIIIFGGPQANANMQGNSLIKSPDVDFVAQGEGEETLLELVRKVVSGENILPLAGTLYKEGGKIVSGPDREIIKNLDSLPFPDFSDFDFSVYKEPFKIPISSSRGCINRCIFCNDRIHWKGYRSRSGEAMFEEVKYQLKKHPGVFYFDFQDCLVNGNINALERFCDLIINEGVQIQWAGQAILRKEMNYDFFVKLKKSGCVCLAYGLETASPPLREKIGKIFSRGVDIEKLLEDSKRAKVYSTLNFMFGLPGETDREAEENITFIKKNASRITEVNPSQGFCLLGPGTLAYENPGKYGLDLKNGPEYWESKDGTNNFLKRMSRFERFIAAAHELNIPCTYTAPVYVGKNEAIANYYFTIGEYKKAIPYYDNLLKEDISNRICSERLKVCYKKTA